MKSWKDLVVMLLLTLGTTLASLLLSTDSMPSPEPDQPQEATGSEWIQPAPAKKMYGIPLASYDIINGKVRRGESLAELLHPHGVSLQKILMISQLSDTLIDERKIRPGNSYTIFSTSDTTPAYFVYEKNPLNYVVIRLASDSLWAQNGEKTIESRLQFASGTIETSLWESMRDSRANPMLAIELSEIFAWAIDFFGVQKGDRYKVIYEESFVDSQSIGINRIMGAWIYHNETDFWGIPFEQNEVRSFFDEERNSLRKAFLKAPLRFSRISSGFSHSRLHPVLKIRRPHHGVDYVAPTGTPVLSVGDGVVTKAAYQKGGGGNYVKIKHNSVYSTAYMHLSRFGKGIRQGVYVKQGDIIGYVGSTGLSTGPHLDFRFYKNGSAVNPLKVEAPPVEPVDEQNRISFEIIRIITMQSLKLM
ncbi:MAG: peptidoglycan DD-metalloendopeptidase family protein [Bacteroidales bacterium]|nr:peptidoglycan DD-metalloendopeptidase family protein [Bacteroidales bacterium]